MKNIKHFLKEQTEGEGEKLKHIEHLEDLPLNNGEKGLKTSIDALEKVKNHIKQGRNNSDLTMKHDGSPSLVYGHHPDSGKFFVASKSAFNKTPKINYTDRDIEENHGHAPGLVEKLKHALHHLPKIVPEKGVYQGDVLYSGNDVDTHAGKLNFRPNTIKYSTPINSKEGQKISKSKFGIYTHTEYRGKNSASMNAHFDPDLSKFKNNPDVYHREPGHDTSKVNLSDSDEKEHDSHVNAAWKIHIANKDKMYEPLNKIAKGKEGGKTTVNHADMMKEYINKTVRTGENPSVDGLKTHHISKFGKDIDDTKSPAAKANKSENLKNNINHIETNKEHFGNLFQMHHHLQKAKDILVHTLSQHTGGLEHSVNGKKTKPEGFVLNHEGSPIKLNDRAEFNRLNFERANAR